MTDLQVEEQRLAESKQAVYDAYGAIYRLFPDEEKLDGAFSFPVIDALTAKHPKLLEDVQTRSAVLRNTEDDLFLNGSPVWENNLRDTMVKRVAELAGTT